MKPPLVHGKATGTAPSPCRAAYNVCYTGVLHMSNISFTHPFRKKLMQKLFSSPLHLTVCKFINTSLCISTKIILVGLFTAI